MEGVMEWIELARVTFVLAVFCFAAVLLRQILLYVLLFALAALGFMARGIARILRPRSNRK